MRDRPRRGRHDTRRSTSTSTIPYGSVMALFFFSKYHTYSTVPTGSCSRTMQYVRCAYNIMNTRNDMEW